MILLITVTGKALYRGVDDTKPDDYTVTTIFKHIGNSVKNAKDGQDETPIV